MKKFPSYLQMDKKDCGAVCLQIICKYYGKYISIYTLKEKTNITREGVSLGDLSNAAKLIGFNSMPIKMTSEDLLKRIPLPCIVYWNRSHYLVVYKTSDRFVHVSDPALGLNKHSVEEFKKNGRDKREKEFV